MASKTCWAHVDKGSDCYRGDSLGVDEHDVIIAALQDTELTGQARDQELLAQAVDGSVLEHPSSNVAGLTPFEERSSLQAELPSKDKIDITVQQRQYVDAKHE